MSRAPYKERVEKEAGYAANGTLAFRGVAGFEVSSRMRVVPGIRVVETGRVTHHFASFSLGDAGKNGTDRKHWD